MAFGPPKVLKNGSWPATTVDGGTALLFVISTEAQLSGEISVWMLFLGYVFDRALRWLKSANKVFFK
jgi:hypothetical protein